MFMEVILLLTVPYGKSVRDKLGCVHSIDNLVVEYLVRSFSSSAVLDSLADEVFSPSIPGWDKAKNTQPLLPACSKYSWFCSSIWGGGVYVQYGQYRDFDSVDRKWSEYPLLRVKFNPNKYLNTPAVERLFDWVARECDNGVLIKLDYAVDVPCKIGDVRERSRKEPGLFKGTRYYGQRNKHGRFKIYNKRAESDLPDDVTRVEWTLCAGKSLVLDDVWWLTAGPSPLPDVSELGSQAHALALMLLDIRSLGGDVQRALGYLDKRTQKKLEPYTIGTGVQLLDGCCDRLKSLVEFYCDALSVSCSFEGVNGFSVGADFSRVSTDDLEADELPF